MHLSGEANLTQGSRSESNTLASNEERGVKAPGVTRMRPETGRSKPGHGEVEVKLRGGQKRCYVQVFF